MGFFEKIKAGLTRTKENIGHSFDQLFAGELNDDFYDELEETLILGDMGVDTTMKAVEELRRRVKAEKIKDMEGARTCLRRVLTDMLQVGEPALKLDTTPSVALFIGVNGVGKTTTIGKLSARMKGEGHRVLMAAADEADLAAMIATSLEIDDRPSAFRYPRGDGVGVDIPDLAAPLEIGRGRIVREGTSVAILSLGTRLQESLKAADLLAARGVSATVADARFAKPLDADLILRLAREHEALITVEEGAMGGFGAFVLQLLAEKGALDGGLKVRTLHLPDIFQDQDKPEAMYAAAGLNADQIAAAAFSALGVGATRAARA